MIIETIKFKEHPCFKNHWSGFDVIKPINVIIGRNNSGKTHLLELVNILCTANIEKIEWPLLCTGHLDEKSLKQVFQEGVGGGVLGGEHWRDHGRLFTGTPVEWIAKRRVGPKLVGPNISITDIKISPDALRASPHSFSPRDEQINARKAHIGDILARGTTPLQGRLFRRISAERDITASISQESMQLFENGNGATNIIRRYLLSSAPYIVRDLVHRDLLEALNSIFSEDGQFTEIQVQEHDHEQASTRGTWEVYLGEAKKGLVPLSRSGSGLKTVILVLLQLLVIPKIEKKEKNSFVFGFEELENNLHPALLRRLFQYIENYAIQEKAIFFLTTHSSTALDYFSASKDAQIIHVTHDGESAKAITISAHFDKLNVISELGLKPSDLLQANCLIWVEGPSDRIYVNRWINLYSDGKLKEGRDYQCVFYGGSLLANTQFTAPESAVESFINLILVNPNVIVICDSDKTMAKDTLKPRVQRIQNELQNIPDAHIWITDAKEIENYIPDNILTRALGKVTADENALPAPRRYERFFPAGKGTASYWKTVSGYATFDKIDIANAVSPLMTKENLAGRFDLPEQMQKIVAQIQKHNGK